MSKIQELPEHMWEEKKTHNLHKTDTEMRGIAEIEIKNT